MKIPNNLKIEIATEVPHLTSTEAVAVCTFDNEPRVSPVRHDYSIQRTCENLVREGEFESKRYRLGYDAR